MHYKDQSDILMVIYKILNRWDKKKNYGNVKYFWLMNQILDLELHSIK